MLQLENITLHYDQSRILHGVNMVAERGQITCLIGVNGVGKTSLLSAISGTHPYTDGRYVLDGQELSPKTPAHVLARTGVGYVPQGRAIFPLLTVRENMESGFACLNSADRHLPDEMFELFPVLKEMQNRRGGDLSGGQQQQLAIARALITRPKLLLLDEPTEGIQPNIIQHIGRVIGHLRDQGEMAIVLVEQYFEFAYGLADRIYSMRRGEMILSGQKTELKKSDVLATLAV